MLLCYILDFLECSRINILVNRLLLGLIMVKNKERFYFHLTDTFGGELNYCWIKRYFVDAYSLHGALCIISRELSYNFTLVYDGLYHAKGACIAICFESWETIDYLKDCQIETFNDYKNVTGA